MFYLIPAYQFFSSIDHVFGVISQKSSANPRSSRFFSKSFIIVTYICDPF